MLEWTKDPSNETAANPTSIDNAYIMLYTGWGVLLIAALGLYFDPCGLGSLAEEQIETGFDDDTDFRQVFERNMRESMQREGSAGRRQSMRESTVEFEVEDNDEGDLLDPGNRPPGIVLKRYLTRQADATDEDEEGGEEQIESRT